MKFLFLNFMLFLTNEKFLKISNVIKLEFYLSIYIVIKNIISIYLYKLFH